MKDYPMFVAGIVARTVGIVATIYAEWLLEKIADGTGAGIDFWQDLKRFCRWLMRVLSEQWGGRRRHQRDYEEQWQPGMYGAN